MRLFYLVQNTYMNWLFDWRQCAAESDALCKLAIQVPIRRMVPHLDPGRIGASYDLIVADGEPLSAAYDFAAGISAH
jgi:hypothetical protein